MIGLAGAVNPLPEALMKKKAEVSKSAEDLALEQEVKRLRLSLAQTEMSEMSAKAYYITKKRSNPVSGLLRLLLSERMVKR